ncbi:MAG: hypothetical protein LBR79_03005 [Oscillospiraceae bacterium]|nr:hypothetical protein [Oscillospiraceae bacterium]
MAFLLPPARRRGKKLLSINLDCHPKASGKRQYIAFSFEKRLIFMTFSRPTAGRKYTDKFTFEDCFKS